MLPVSLRPFAGILAISLAMTCFVCGDVLMRLVLADLAISQGLFLRGVVACSLVLCVIAARGELAALRWLFSPPSVIRAGVEYFALVFFYIAFLVIPIAEAVAIVQMTPLLLVLVVGLWLKEPVRPIEYALVAIGFLGTLLIVRPGAASFNPAALLALGAAILAVGRDLMSRRVDRKIPPFVVTLTMLLVVGSGMVPGYFVETWKMPKGWQMGFIGLAGILIASAHFLLFMAFRLDRPPRLAPFFYIALVISILAGILVFDEWPTYLALAGMGLIAGAGIAAARQSAQH